METIQHKLQQFDPGMVWLDNRNHVLAMNGIAMETLGARPGELIGEDILSIHPESSREKVRWLLEHSSCPVTSPPPMTMMINTLERVLLIKVSKMCGADSVLGTCMIFYDLTDLATTRSNPDDDLPADESPASSINSLCTRTSACCWWIWNPSAASRPMAAIRSCSPTARIISVISPFLIWTSGWTHVCSFVCTAVTSLTCVMPSRLKKWMIIALS